MLDSYNQILVCGCLAKQYPSFEINMSVSLSQSPMLESPSPLYQNQSQKEPCHNGGMTRATRLRTEIVIVLGLSLGASAVYSIVSLIAALGSDTSLANQSVALNPSRSTRQWLDATYQFLGPFFELFAVALALYLLSLNGRNPFRQSGCDRARPWWGLVVGWHLVAGGGGGGGACVLGCRACSRNNEGGRGIQQHLGLVVVDGADSCVPGSCCGAQRRNYCRRISVHTAP